MQNIGLIGGMSWESTAHYYRLINETVRERLGSPHSAKVILSSVDFGEIARLQHDGEWPQLGKIMAAEAKRLERAGADCVILCTNTMHLLTADIENATSIPLLHIADATAAQIKADGISKVGLLGTAFTMEQDFYKGRLKDQHAIDVIIPDDQDRAIVHKIIYDELVNGIIRDESREHYRTIMANLVEDGAKAIILGCTEIMLLVGEDDSKVPLYDTTAIHALAAVDWALR